MFFSLISKLFAKSLRFILKPMYNIQFGTDGWRALIARDFTVENVRRVANATLEWMRKKNYHKVVIGYDCRFGGEMFQQEIAHIMADGGMECWVGSGFVSTPMVSYAVVKYQADLGIVITASHNPHTYNGYKLKSSLGGPLLPREIAEIEALISIEAPSLTSSFQEWVDKNQIHTTDFESDYFNHVQNHFNLPLIRTNVRLAYDAMFGAGQRILKRLLPDARTFHADWNPGFHGTPPEPIERNLGEIMDFLRTHPGQYLGMANDGDADRIALMDDQGQMVDSHHLLLLLIQYLHVYKKLTGDVVISFSVTNKVKKLASHYGLNCITTKIGFKYIAEYMTSQDVLVGGEESGGLAIKGHLPERDGIWIGLTLLQYMSETGKSLQSLIEEVYQIVGPFHYDRWDLHLNHEQINLVKSKLESGIPHWGSYAVELHENLDGHKFHFSEDRWLLIRTSGTEPVLRIYAQGNSKEEVIKMLTTAQEVLQV